jgi:hypothetical protein
LCFLPNFGTSYIETTALSTKRFFCQIEIASFAKNNTEILLSESESDLQAQLDAFHEYCLIWKLKVNTDKTKIVIVGSGRTPQNLSFKFN